MNRKLKFGSIVLAVALAITMGCSKSESQTQKQDEPASQPANPAEAPAGEDSAIAQQRDSYPLDTCVVTGEKLGGHGEVVEYVHEGRLVRFCCNGCVKDFAADPATYLSKLDAAVKPAG